MAAITIQNGCHMVRLFNLYNPTNFQKDWSNNEFLWIFYDFFHFLSGGHFEMAAILKILKLNCTSPHSELFLCQVSLRCVKFPKICNFRFFHISMLPWQRQAILDKVTFVTEVTTFCDWSHSNIPNNGVSRYHGNSESTSFKIIRAPGWAW